MLEEVYEDNGGDDDNNDNVVDEKWEEEGVNGNIGNRKFTPYSSNHPEKEEKRRTNEQIQGPISDFYKQIVDLKKQNSALKVLLSVGGADSEQAHRYSDVANSQSLTTAFIANAIAFLRQHRFDGLDVNWVFPGSDNRVAFQLFIGVSANGSL